MWTISCTKLFQGNSARKSHDSEMLSLVQAQTSNKSRREIRFRFSLCKSAHFTTPAVWQRVRWNSYPFLRKHHILRSGNYLSPNTVHFFAPCWRTLQQVQQKVITVVRGIQRHKTSEVKETKYVTLEKYIFRYLKYSCGKRNKIFFNDIPSVEQGTTMRCSQRNISV